MNYEYHPLANIFPLIEGSAFDDLVEDVRVNGVREPIWMYQHQILDGRNRYRAAKEVGIRCEIRRYEGDDPIGFVVSLNLHRRHLTESQRAMVASKLANMPRGATEGNQRASKEENKSANLPNRLVSQADAAKMLNVSARTVTSASKVRDEAAPELIEAVERGEASVSAAAAVAALPKDQQQEVVKGGKKEIQRAAREYRQTRQELVKQPGTEHVMHIINQMDLMDRYAARNSMTAHEVATRFLSEIDIENPVIQDRLNVAIPIMTALGKIASALDGGEIK